MYLIMLYVPTTHSDSVKEAMFQAGGGKIGNYSHCCWQVLGQGQFKPLENSSAFIGSVNQVEQVAEYKIEMVCAAPTIKAVIAAMIKAHPYEEPAYQIISLENAKFK